MEQEALQSLALAVAGERSVASVLQRIVAGLGQQPHVALTRIWLRGPGDLCASCPMRRECPDQRACLHLVASAGQPTHAVSEDWSRLTGAFRRFPLTVRKIGHIGATGAPLLLPDLTQEPTWIARPEWVQREGIRSFAGQPLLFRDDLLGVLAVFSRVPLDVRGFAWLRIFADQAAVAIANARAFEEIERLRQQLQLENDYLREAVQGDLALGALVGHSPALRHVVAQIARVAPTKATVLITGETGTGKELVARAIHAHSPRHPRPLITVNCGAVPRELFESEFFGHVKGAFTGALKDRVGRFQLADGGTLFLDEVGELPLELQSKLLRVLQEGEVERVGEERTRRVDVRVIAATNRDLRREVAAGRFRPDLYYRISPFPLEVPPLRQRLDDIPLLATHFLQHACHALHCAPVTLTEPQLRLLQAYAWPGNIRELQNVMERAVILAQGGVVSFAGLFPPGLADTPRAPAATQEAPLERAVLSQDAWKRQERENLRAALAQTKGKIYGPEGAAALLGIKPTTLAYRLKVLGLHPKAPAP